MRVASSSRVLKLHEITSGELVSTYQPDYADHIKYMSWNKDGSWMAVVPSDGFTQIVSFRKMMRPLLRIKEIPTACAVFPNTSRRRIAMGTMAREILIYDLKTKKVLRRCEKCSSDIKLIDFTINDTHIAAALSDGQINIFNNNLSSQTKFCLPNSKTITCMKCPSWKTNYVGGGSEEGVVALFDAQVNKVVYSANTHFAAVSGVTFSPQRMNLLISTGLDKQLIFNDAICSGKVVHIPLEFIPTSVDFAQNGHQLAISGEDGKIYIYDTRSVNIPINSFKAHDSKIKSVLIQKFENVEQPMFDPPSEEFKEWKLRDNNSCQRSDRFLACRDNINPKREFCQNKHMGAGDCVKIGNNGDFHADVAPSTKHVLFKNENVKKGVEKQKPAVKQLTDVPSRNIFQRLRSPKTPPLYIFNQFVNQPVLRTTDSVTSVKSNEIRKIARKEIKQEAKKLQVNIHTMLSDIIYQIQCEMLDIQLSFGKSFVQVEKNLNKLKHELFAEEGNANDEILVHENNKLRRELTNLQEKLLSDRVR